MDNENNSTEQSPAQEEEKQQILPDGIGMSIEEIRTMLIAKHNTKIPKDDPILMVVSMLNAALTEQAKLQKAHEVALGKMMSEHTKNYVQNTENGMKEIMETLSSLTTKGLNEAAKDMVKFKMSMFYCTIITFISSLLIVGTFVLKAVK